MTDDTELGYFSWHADAALVVEAVNAAPALLDELDRLRKVAEAARAYMSLHAYPAALRDALAALDR